MKNQRSRYHEFIYIIYYYEIKLDKFIVKVFLSLNSMNKDAWKLKKEKNVF